MAARLRAADVTDIELRIAADFLVRIHVLNCELENLVRSFVAIFDGKTLINHNVITALVHAANAKLEEIK